MIAEHPKLVRRLPRVLAAAAADMEAKFMLHWLQAALQRADDAGRNTRRMPVHPHHGAERLEPERVRQPPQEFVAAVVMHDGLRDDGAERGHACRQPGRDASAMQGEVGTAATSWHRSLRF